MGGESSDESPWRFSFKRINSCSDWALSIRSHQLHDAGGYTTFQQWLWFARRSVPATHHTLRVAGTSCRHHQWRPSDVSFQGPQPYKTKIRCSMWYRMQGRPHRFMFSSGSEKTAIAASLRSLSICSARRPSTVSSASSFGHHSVDVHIGRTTAAAYFTLTTYLVVSLAGHTVSLLLGGQRLR